MKHIVVILPRAQHDFHVLHDFIKQRSKQGSATWTNAFYRALKRLEDNPFSCQLAPESGASQFEVYQLLFRTRKGKPYRALFSVRGEHVFIRHLRGPGQAFLDNIDDLELPPT